ncbi:hypothetical protein K9M79_07380 [Candidatus Woesearchaeota archaeon]|nr:hypothetical protein [Candidatus Woesearchaeota archaeon]
MTGSDKIGCFLFLVLLMLLIGCSDNSNPDINQIQGPGTDDSVNSDDGSDTDMDTDSSSDLNQEEDSEIETDNTETQKIIEKTANVQFDAKYLHYANEKIKYKTDRATYEISIASAKSFGTRFQINKELTDYVRQDQKIALDDGVWLWVGSTMRTADNQFVELKFIQKSDETYPDELIEKDIEDQTYEYSESDEDDMGGEDYEAYISYYTDAAVKVKGFDSDSLDIFISNYHNPTNLAKFLDGSSIYMARQGDCYACWPSGDKIVAIDTTFDTPFEKLIFLVNDYLEKYPSDLKEDYLENNCLKLYVGETVYQKGMDIEVFVVSDSAEEASFKIDGEAYSHVAKDDVIDLDNAIIFVKDLHYDVDGDRDQVEICIN